MDFHVLTPAGPELLMYVVDGVLVIVPAAENAPQMPISAENAGHEKRS